MSDEKASTFYYLNYLWIFLMGVIIAIVGLFTLFFMNIGPGSFALMLIGLFFTAAGSIYAKRKMNESYLLSSPYYRKETPYPESWETEERGPETETVNEDVLEEIEESVERPETRRFALPRALPKPAFLERKPQPVTEAAPKAMPEQRLAQRPGQIPEKRFEEPSQETEEPAKSVSERKILKIVVCPKCGAENQAEDRFCYECGKKLKKEPRKPLKLPAKPQAKPKISVKTKIPAKTQIKIPAKPSAKSLKPQPKVSRKKPSAKKPAASEETSA